MDVYDPYPGKSRKLLFQWAPFEYLLHYYRDFNPVLDALCLKSCGHCIASAYSSCAGVGAVRVAVQNIFVYFNVTSVGCCITCRVVVAL